MAGWWLSARLLRVEILGPANSSEPGWYILLDLYRALATTRKVQITSLAPMIGAPYSTTGRCARQLINDGMIVAKPDPSDRRRSFVELSPRAVDLMRGYFAVLAAKGAPPYFGVAN